MPVNKQVKNIIYSHLWGVVEVDASEQSVVKEAEHRCVELHKCCHDPVIYICGVLKHMEHIHRLMISFYNCLSVCLSLSLTVRLSVCLSLSLSLTVCLCVCLSLSLSF